jgi:hypothetical protein
MGIPGFTAQASLYKADHYRQVAASSVRRLKGQIVVPQDYHQPVVIRELCWWGNVWVDPAGYLHATYYCGGRPVRSF